MAKTPSAIIAKINQAMNKGLEAADLHNKLSSQGMDAEPSSPAAFEKLIHDEIAKWREVIESSGINKT